MLHALLLAVGLSLALPLDGPWRFHVGADLRWADPSFNCGAWHTRSLAAPADANDGDQGITHFTTGWAAQGCGYQGFASYRIRANDSYLAQSATAVAGAAMADSACQIYVDGRLLGGIEIFNGTKPQAYAIHPAMFAIPQALRRSLLVAVRVWMGP